MRTLVTISFAVLIIVGAGCRQQFVHSARSDDTSPAAVDEFVQASQEPALPEIGDKEVERCLREGTRSEYRGLEISHEVAVEGGTWSHLRFVDCDLPALGLSGSNIQQTAKLEQIRMRGQFIGNTIEWESVSVGESTTFRDIEFIEGASQRKIWLLNCRFEGHVTLSDVRQFRDLEFNQCTFDSGLTIEKVALEKNDVTVLAFNQVTISGPFALSQITVDVIDLIDVDLDNAAIDFSGLSSTQVGKIMCDNEDFDVIARAAPRIPLVRNTAPAAEDLPAEPEA